MDTTHTTFPLRLTALLVVATLGLSAGSSAEALTEPSVMPTSPRPAFEAPALLPPTVAMDVPAPADPPVPPLSSSEHATVAWAEGLYANAGLSLPDVDVSFHNDKAACHGAEGRWEHAEGAVDRVMVCTTHEKPDVQDEWQRRTLLHELAHAWAGENLDAASRDRFVALRGLAAWYEGSAEWSAQGAEHAAEIISWGVIDMKIHMWNLPNATCPAMAAGYYLMTGMEPTTGLAESCRA